MHYRCKMAISKIEKKIDKLDQHLSSIDITLAKQSVILDEHVKRTNLLEERITPIERHVSMINGALKFLGILAVIIGIAVGIEQLMGLIK